jgi:hypothetical protein
MPFCTQNVNAYITGFLHTFIFSYKGSTNIKSLKTTALGQKCDWSSGWLCISLRPSITRDPLYLPVIVAIKTIIQMGEVQFYYCAYKWWYNKGSRTIKNTDIMSCQLVFKDDKAGMCNLQDNEQVWVRHPYYFFNEISWCSKFTKLKLCIHHSMHYSKLCSPVFTLFLHIPPWCHDGCGWKETLSLPVPPSFQQL